MKRDYFVTDKVVSLAVIKNLGVKRIYTYDSSTSNYEKIELSASYIDSHGSNILKSSYKFIVNKDNLDLALIEINNDKKTLPTGYINGFFHKDLPDFDYKENFQFTNKDGHLLFSEIFDPTSMSFTPHQESLYLHAIDYLESPNPQAGLSGFSFLTVFTKTEGNRAVDKETLIHLSLPYYRNDDLKLKMPTINPLVTSNKKSLRSSVLSFISRSSSIANLDIIKNKLKAYGISTESFFETFSDLFNPIYKNLEIPPQPVFGADALLPIFNGIRTQTKFFKGLDKTSIEFAMYELFTNLDGSIDSNGLANLV